MTILIVFYESIISILTLFASHSIPTSVTSTRYNIVPRWNEYVKEHHSLAKDAQWWWKLDNKPRHGHIYDNMRVTRACLKYALKLVRNQEDMARADSLAQDLSDQDVDGFWKTMHKMNNCNTILANVIDSVSGPDSIEKSTSMLRTALHFRYSIVIPRFIPRANTAQS